MTNYLYEQMERTEEPIGLDSLSKEEIIFIFFIWQSVTANPGQEISQETLSGAWEAAHLIHLLFVRRGYGKKEAIQSFVQGICEESTSVKGEQQIIDAVLKQTGAIDNIWEAVEAVDSDIAQKKLDRLLVIKLMVESSCPNLTPQGVEEVVNAIAQKIQSPGRTENV